MVSCFFALNRKGEYMQKSEKTVRGADVSEKTPVFKRKREGLPNTGTPSVILCFCFGRPVPS